MRKIFTLLLTLLLFQASYSQRSSTIVAGASPFQDSLWTMDTAQSYNIVSRYGPTLTGFTIQGINGLAKDPITGLYYAILKLSGVSGRVLAKINLYTGVCTQVGNLGDNFATINFNSAGQLYGVTGDGASVPETMYTINKADASKVLFRALGNGADGEVISFCPDNGRFYHWSGNGSVVWERFDNSGVDVIQGLSYSGYSSGEVFGALYLGRGRFLVSNISSLFYIWDTLGNVTQVGPTMPDDLRGLVMRTCVTNITASPTAICPGGTSLLTAIGGVSYQWFKNGVLIAGQTSLTYSANAAGLYNCIMTDTCGITDSLPVGVTITANTTPTITCPANITVSNTPGQCGAVVTYTVTSSGTPAPTLSYSIPSGSFFPKGVTTVIVTATNSCGSSNCSFTVTVNDTQAPTITCPANVTTTTTAGQCGAIVNFPTPVINDNCPFPTGATVNLQQTASNSITVGNSVSCNAGGIHTDNSYYRVYDLSTLSLTGPLTLNTVSFGIEQANAPSGSQPVTVKLYTLNGTFTLANLTQVGSQTFTVPNQNGTVFTGTLTTPVTVGPTAKLVIELFTPAGAATSSSFFIGSNTSAETGPSYLLASACGVTSPLTVASIGFPNMHIVLNASGTLPAVSSVVSVPASGSFFPKGTTTVNSTVTDAAGNTATCSFTVTVNDNQAPAITCPANITVSTPVGSCTATVSYTVTATDNCPGVTTALVSGLASGSAFPLGVTTVTHRATDLANNQTTCSFTVTVNDGQLPVITSQPAATVTACATDNVNLTIVATNVQSYQWQQYNGTAWVNIAGATAATYALPAITLAGNTGTYRCQVVGRCTTIISNTSSVYVNPLPTVTIVASNPPVILPGQTTTLTAVVNPTGGSFIWFKNGQSIGGGSTLANLGIDDIGTYKVTYTDGNNCKQTSADLVLSAEPSTRFYVYPNPNTGTFQVRFYNQINQAVTITVYDSKGSKVYQKGVTTGNQYSSYQVVLGVKASGVFIVEVRDAGGNIIYSKPVLVNAR